MIRGLYTAASGMITRQAQQESLSNNIANINTPGYKKDKIILKSFNELLIETRDRQIGSHNFKSTLGTLEFGVGIDENKPQFSQGILEDTGRDLDFAVSGDGFFTVVNSKGEERYTRDGRFKINSEGYLTTIEGDKVIGIDKLGHKLPIKVKGDEIKLGAGGIIENSDGQVKLLLESFKSGDDLVKEGTNYYKAVKDPTVSTESTIEQGKLERSNVDALEAITDMIAIMRSYESNQKVIQQMDETLGKTVNEVGSIK